MTTEKLLSRHPLDNGLTIEFWDLSRPMIGDRWIITLELRITIPINAANLPAGPAGPGSRHRQGPGS